MHRSSFPPLLRFTLGLLLATALTATRPAAATDTDGDGIADEIDACPDTPPGDLGGDDGCSMCPCDAQLGGTDWGSHPAYVQCVSGAAKQRRQERAITRKEARTFIRSARKSSCGDVALTRCCVYPDNADQLDSVIGQCRLMTPDDCATLGDTHPFVDDIDAGSCLPNPCVF
jgi:hypothetical protein